MPEYLHTAVVRGRGRFPLDMLRYDACWPSGPEDVVRITSHGPDVRRIELRKRTTRKAGPTFTIQRWASFGWEVVSQTTRRIEP